MKTSQLCSTLSWVGWVVATPIVSSQKPHDATFIPATNASIDKHDLTRLQTTVSPALLYSEVPPQQLAMSTIFEVRWPAIVLENSDRFEDIYCSPDKSSITLTFQDHTAFEMAASWPDYDLFAGTIVGTLPSATASSAITAVAPDASDLSEQVAFQNKLQSAGLPSFDDVFASLSDLLTAGSTNSSTNSSTTTLDDGSNGSNDSGDGNDGNDSDDDEDSDQEDDTTSNTTVSARSSRLAKRYSFSDFLGDVDTYVCNDFVTSLSEKIEDACDTIEAAETIYCFATGCYESSSASPPVQYSFDQSWNMVMPGFSGPGYVQRTANSVLSCPNCGMTISNLEVKGTIVVDLVSMTVKGAAISIYQDSEATLEMKLTTTAATSGTWSYVMSSYQLSAITASGVFTINPELLYGLGASWTTAGAATYSFGHSVSISGATVDLDVVNGYVDSYNSWQPNIQVTSPTFSGNTAASLIPFVQSSLKISIVVLGQTLQNSLTLTTQANLGGTYQALSYAGVTNAVSISGGTSNLYSSGGYGAPVCYPVSISPPSMSQVSAFGAAPSAAAFCTSWIGYKPSASVSTTTMVVTVPTSTITVTGNGTTTITPDAVTFSETITASVSSSPTASANAKRTLAAQISSSSHGTKRTDIDILALDRRHDLIARKVVATPTVVSTWAPQQVSAACSMIATGVKTLTSTTTSTTLFGVTTSTVQGTVTAPAPTVTTNATIYVPAVAPANLVSRMYLWSIGGSTAFPCDHYDNGWHYLCVALYDGPTFSITADGGYASTWQVVNGLEPGWGYNFTVQAGFQSSTDSCTVTYKLDEDVIASYSPTNNWDGGSDTPSTVDGPYEIYPTASSQTLSISMVCAEAGGHAQFANAAFKGPYAT
ncbi:hypothetical protein MBLNU459_g0141t1 [Dothideomycetes sp. NU459]